MKPKGRGNHQQHRKAKAHIGQVGPALPAHGNEAEVGQARETRHMENVGHLLDHIGHHQPIQRECQLRQCPEAKHDEQAQVHAHGQVVATLLVGGLGHREHLGMHELCAGARHPNPDKAWRVVGGQFGKATEPGGASGPIQQLPVAKPGNGQLAGHRRSLAERDLIVDIELVHKGRPQPQF